MLALEAVAIAGALTLALDMYAHARVQELGGVNVWGYRGPVARQRQPNEIRVVVVGGTRAFGWGQPASALASEIRRLIMLTTDQRGGELRPVVVINIARLGVLPDSYPWMIEHFSYLKPDYICLYDDLGVRGAIPTHGDSAVFALTGYQPVLPLVLREKAMLWRFGDLSRGYAPDERRSAETTSLLRRAAGSVLGRAAGAAGAVDRLAAGALALGRRDEALRSENDPDYADAMMTAIGAARRRARGVVVALSPAETPAQTRNLGALRARLDNDAESSTWLRVVDLGVERGLVDNTVRLDGWNYGGTGIALVAKNIAPEVLSLLDRP